jgi:hypothetical protein
MDRYRIEPDYGDTVYLEDEPLKATSEFEVLSYPRSEGGRDGEDERF